MQCFINNNETLQARGYQGKSYISKRGNQIEGKPFSLSRLYTLLNNPLYCGKIRHKGNIYDGEHAAIINDDLWQRVQSKMNKKRFSKRYGQSHNRPSLLGKLFDYHGNRMSPTYSYKYSTSGRYKMRYYINREIVKTGKTTSEFTRMRADHLENMIHDGMSDFITKLIDAITESDNHLAAAAILPPLQQHKAQPEALLQKAILFPKHMQCMLHVEIPQKYEAKEKLIESVTRISSNELSNVSIKGNLFSFAIMLEASYRRANGKMHILTQAGEIVDDIINAKYCYPNDKTFAFIAKSFYWHQQINKGIYTTQKEIADSDGHSVEYVKRALKQRFLSPKIINHITSRDTQEQISIESLIQCNHWDWNQQENMLIGESSN